MFFQVLIVLAFLGQMPPSKTDRTGVESQPPVILHKWEIVRADGAIVRTWFAFRVERVKPRLRGELTVQEARDALCELFDRECKFLSKYSTPERPQGDYWPPLHEHPYMAWKKECMEHGIKLQMDSMGFQCIPP